MKNKTTYYDKTRAYYERVGNLWGIYTNQPYLIESFKYPGNHVKAIIERANIKDGDTVLDCGCGFGKVLASIQSIYPACKLSGVTLNQPHVDRKQHSNISVENFEKLHHSDSSQDVVLFIESFNHANDKRAVLSECYRVLKPGGTLFILDQCVSNQTYRQVGKDTALRKLYREHMNFYGASPVCLDYITKRATSIGFEVSTAIESVPNTITTIQNSQIKRFIVADFLPTIYSELVFRKH